MSISGTVCQTVDPSTCTDSCCSTTSQSSAPSWTPKRSHLTPTPSTGFVFLPSDSCLTITPGDSDSHEVYDIQIWKFEYVAGFLSSLHSWAVCFPATAFLTLPRPYGTPTSSRRTPSSSSSSCLSSSSMPSMFPLMKTLQKHNCTMEI